MSVLYTITDDKGETLKRYFEKNMNADARYQDMVIELKPIPTKEANGVESWTPQDSVREQEIRGSEGEGDEKRDHYYIGFRVGTSTRSELCLCYLLWEPQCRRYTGNE